MLGSEAAVVRAAVVTVMVSGVVELALRLTLPGVEQLAPVGAPVQAMVAVALIPPPPTTKLYFAEAPADTVADGEAPEAGPSPITDAVPDEETDCGLPEALSMNARLALSSPFATGVKITVTAQLAPEANELPQVFVCWKADDSLP